jgi:2-keto-4-pentenoate hydratase/2-oxohepta-3-ene-1,7-dioic acid hydratase in catechol pathway
MSVSYRPVLGPTARMLNSDGVAAVRLISVRSSAGERVGIAVEDRWAPIEAFMPDGPRTIMDLLADGDRHIPAIRTAITNEDAGLWRPLAEAELLAPVPRPGKVVAIGRNYRDHAAEEGADPPAAPLIFAKWPSSVIAHDADIRWDPALTSQVDYEAELAVVIGRRARLVSIGEALDYILGYTCLNDVSARDLQFADGQWVRGKSLDTFCPMGPWVVTTDEIPDPQSLSIRCVVAGEIMQDANTAQMYFSVAEIVSYCSRSFTLEPGDVIATGTPAGVGAFRTPPRFLADGEHVAVEIEGIGRLENVCRMAPVEALA